MFSAIGEYRLHAVSDDRYTRFIYTCALWWASLPIVTGDWRWSLLFLPAALVVASFIDRRRRAAKAAKREQVI
jgi:hypothetical protein